MKNLALFLVTCTLTVMFACSKNSHSEKFNLLTGPVWASDSLLVNGTDASGPGGLLENFKGDAKFNTDYTGYFGKYTGTWRFAFEETQLVITTDSLPIPITAIIDQLDDIYLKINTSLLIPPTGAVTIRMTFNAK